jgi:hypothetical protein
MNKIINTITILAIVGATFMFSMAVTEGVLVPYDLMNAADRPEGFALTSNNFFESGLGSYLPTIVVIATFMGLVIRRKLLVAGPGSVLISGGLLLATYVATVYAYQYLLVPLASRVS